MEINAAREMFATTVRARQPAGQQHNQQQQQQQQRVVQPQEQFSTPSIPVNNSQLHNVSVPARSHDGKNCTNPQCAHCGQVIIPSPAASYPINETPSISVGDWEIYTTKRPILSSDEIDEEQERLGFPIPEMIFGNNKIEIKNVKYPDFLISFNTKDALSLVDKDVENLLKVSYSKEWFSTRQKKTQEVKEVAKLYDWTYTTSYKGSIAQNYEFKADEDVKIPIHKLTKPDPILLFDDMVLYEDELGDNGISLVNCKVRVMPERMLLLSRFFLRVDDVIFRIRDTRVYIEFKDGLIIREYKEQEANYNDVMKKIPPMVADPRSYLRDQNWVSGKLPVLKKTTDYIQLDV